jgi:hypothetical protein
MNQTLLQNLRWFISFSMKFFRVVPFLTLAIIFFSLIGNIAKIISFFLPLKIVILLGSDGIPRYFSSTLFKVDRDLLIIWFCAATVCFFLLGLLAKKLVNLTSNLVASKLLAKNQKITLFVSQKDLAISTYSHYSSVVASSIFVFLVLLAVFWFYSSLAILIIVYVFFIFVSFLILYQNSLKFRTYLDLNLSVTMSLVSNLGFFVVFIYVVANYLFFSPPGLIISIISIIACRQLFSQASCVVIGLNWLFQKKHMIDAMFFFNKILSPAISHDDKTIWPLLMSSVRKSWINTLLRDFAPGSKEIIDIYLYYLGTPNIGALCIKDKQGSVYLVKLYETNSNFLAEKEKALMEAKPKGLPAGDLLASTNVGQFKAMLYQLPKGYPVPRKELISVQNELRKRLFEVKPPEDLISRYVRSFPLISKRLNASMLRRIAVVTSTAEEATQLNAFVARLPELEERLHELPLAFVNPRLDTYSLWINEVTLQPIILQWKNWSLEPIGAAWPVSLKEDGEKKLSAKLQTAFTEAIKYRPELKKVSIKNSSLAAMAYALEKNCLQGNFHNALILIKRMLHAF